MCENSDHNVIAGWPSGSKKGRLHSFWPFSIMKYIGKLEVFNVEFQVKTKKMISSRTDERKKKHGVRIIFFQFFKLHCVRHFARKKLRESDRIRRIDFSLLE